MNEFYVITTTKLATPLHSAMAAIIVDLMAALICVAVDATLVQPAVHVGQRWNFRIGMHSWWKPPGGRLFRVADRRP